MFTALLQWLNLLISSYFSCHLFLSIPFIFALLICIQSHLSVRLVEQQAGPKLSFLLPFKFNLADLNLCDTAIISSVSDLT